MNHSYALLLPFGQLQQLGDNIVQRITLSMCIYLYNVILCV